MSTTTLTKSTVRPGALLWGPQNRVFRQVIATPQELLPADDMFVVQSETGYRTFGRLTGRTVKVGRWNRFPSVERFEIDTVVIGDAIWGTPGARIVGTLLVNSDAVVES